MEDKFVMLYVTASNITEARNIARALLVHKLIACANILPKVESLYRMDGVITEDEETVMLLKTLESKITEVQARVSEMHSYQVPCILQISTISGNESYIDWIHKELQGDTPKPINLSP
ncbi:MAG: divalent-cation tolerance protein CutA [Candidatus Cyclonatronum sp.]|uniref:divalent-cation tolerance protein CutA n=1 Tax=Cyclonatronum sp. TaxID=3024185 RepID=UPI0025C74064|nr:divalent-cation tolerance protein CutA [Cyclonatronum sp.]MCC5935079.1 divalent-cation tolerance protein CutA [Balneolales bacterium]MCH8487054.1 divalent-cation tolerance protein CutA [Cyclonatronum sp.]